MSAAAFRLCGITAFPGLLLQVSSVFSPGNFQGFALVNQQRTNRISTGFTVEVSTEGTQLSYSNFDYLGQEPLYWQLPGAFQGNKVSSTTTTTTWPLETTILLLLWVLLLLLLLPLFSFSFPSRCCSSVQWLRPFCSSLASILDHFHFLFLFFFRVLPFPPNSKRVARRLPSVISLFSVFFPLLETASLRSQRANGAGTVTGRSIDKPGSNPNARRARRDDERTASLEFV